MARFSDNEKNSVERSRREADAAGRSGPEWDDSILGAESAFPSTVIGWDNPAAEGDAKPEGDKWAYVAAMIEIQRAEAQAARARTRRIALSITGAVALVALLATLQLFAG